MKWCLKDLWNVSDHLFEAQSEGFEKIETLKHSGHQVPSTQRELVHQSNFLAFHFEKMLFLVHKKNEFSILFFLVQKKENKFIKFFGSRLAFFEKERKASSFALFSNGVWNLNDQPWPFILIWAGQSLDSADNW